MVEDESVGGFLKLTKTHEWVSGDTVVAPLNKKLTAKVCFYAVTFQTCEFFMSSAFVTSIIGKFSTFLGIYKTVKFNTMSGGRSGSVTARKGGN